MERYKKNEAIKVNYLALKKTVGLTDVTMYVYNTLDVLVSTLVMTEVVADSGMDALGLYRSSFTPTTEGQWRIRIESATNGDDISKVFEIGNYKLDDIKDQTQDIEDKVDIIDGNVDLVKIETDKIPAIKTETDKIPAIKTETDKIQTIDDNVDTVNSNVSAIKAKTDNLPANTATELTYIKNKVDSIDTQINPGGYIL
jgi:hypothetical protein